MTCNIEHTFPTSYNICYIVVLINNVLAYYMILILHKGGGPFLYIILALIFKKKNCVSDQFPSLRLKVSFGFNDQKVFSCVSSSISVNFTD